MNYTSLVAMLATLGYTMADIYYIQFTSKFLIHVNGYNVKYMDQVELLEDVNAEGGGYVVVYDKPLGDVSKKVILIADMIQIESISFAPVI
jgi:hypothetical protein